MKPSNENIKQQVATALAEDIGSGDISAELLPLDRIVSGGIYCRENAVICGCDWVDQSMQQVDSNTSIKWLVKDGSQVVANQQLCTLSGKARSLVTSERTALNFLQLMSGVATKAKYYSSIIAHTKAKLLDTRKTIPGLRAEQKYAVLIGGCYNHRFGLYDAFLIKENHIASSSGIADVVSSARHMHPDKLVEIEVENIDQMRQAIAVGVDRILLDNFSLTDISDAVREARGRVELEISGNVNEQTLLQVAISGVDYISMGTLTKNINSIDLSMRLD